MDPWRVKVADARIAEGASDFRIYQQDASGRADIAIAGMWDEEPGGRDLQLHARLLREYDYLPATPELNWRPVDELGRGTWRHTLRGVPAGGLYQVQTRLAWTGADGLAAGRTTDTVHHVGVGDLWIVAGQSNASGTGRGAADDPPELGVHVLRNDETWGLAVHPLNEPRGTDHPNRDGGPGTSPYLAFARTLRRELGYPIGLVQTAKGGSALVEWHPDEGAAPLWHNMVHCVRLAGGRVRGMAWYQGCSDGGRFTPLDAWTYLDRWTAFLTHVRAEFGDIPVVTTQINRWTDIDHEVRVRKSFSVIREMQRRAGRLPGVCVVPSLDIPLSDGIHNSSSGNLILGQRLGRAALGFVYGRPLPWRAPDVRAARRDKDGRTVRLEFDGVTSQLLFLGFGRDEFVVEDSEGNVGIEAAACEGCTVVLSLARPLAGEAQVHGAYDVDPTWTLRDYDTNLPALAFCGLEIKGG